MRPIPLFARVAPAALALALGACAFPYDDVGSSERRGATEVVVERDYPQRVYYRDPQDSLNIYYYESGRPDVVIDRRVLRGTDGRTYYVERDHGGERRYYFDDAKARGRRPGKDHGPQEHHDSGRDGDHGDDHGRR